MSEDVIRLIFPENFGRAWVELLESKLSEHARICYVAMTSFGRESRAGKEAIRRRMGVKSITTVKEAQKELQAAGWIKKIREGGMDGKTPNEWEVYSKPFNGQLPLLGLSTPGAGGAPPQAAQRPLPGREAPPKQEYNQESKGTAAKAASTKHPDQGLFWEKAKEIWKSKHPDQPLEWPNLSGFPKKLYACLTVPGWQEMARRWENMVTDPWARPSLFNLVNHPESWVQKREAKGGNYHAVKAGDDFQG